MATPIADALRATTPEDLKKIGNFAATKALIQRELNVQLSVKGWVTMLETLKRLHCLLSEMNNPLQPFAGHEPLNSCRDELGAQLNLKFTAKTVEALNDTISLLNSIYSKKAFNPAERFEEKKLKNFINSSKLEGIDIHPGSHYMSLESIIAKYKEPVNG